MQLKFCSECSQENHINAKFCLACQNEFPNIPIKKTTQASQPAPVQQPKKAPKTIQFVVDTEKGTNMDASAEEEEGDFNGISEEGVEDLANQLLNYTESITPSRNEGVRIEDVIATEAPQKGRRAKRAVAKTQRQSAKQLLQSTVYKRGEGEEK